MPKPAAGELQISVIVCTRNRAGPIVQLLDSMARLRVPDGLAWELLIVDNGSTDNTREVVERYADRLPIRYAREETPGLSNARNHGVRTARGRYLCWTDDDAEVDPEWLAAYAEAFERHPEAAVFGGRVIPRLDGLTPPWFARLVSRWPVNNIVAERNFGDEPIPLDFSCDRVPWGVNYAIRAQEQRQHAYDPELGVSPTHRRSGEESQLMFEVMSGGATGWWVPGARVHHIFPARRQSRTYFREHFAAIGETLGYLDHTRPVHVMNRDGRQPRLVSGSLLRLKLLIWWNAALFAAFHCVGWTLRSLYYLRKYGMYSGVAAYRRTIDG
jgi:glucosyl-dolichyl phosphate glucuronosyltransferase